MNKIYIVNFIVIVLVIAGVATAKFGNFGKSDNIVATTTSTVTSVIDPIATEATCTQEAKQCPDGSYVVRTGSGCEFAKCPVSEVVTPVPAPSNDSKPKTTPAPKVPAVAPASSVGTVKITSPLNGITVNAGETVNVKVIATGNINKVFIGSAFGSVIDEDPPYELSFKVPPEFLGQLPIVALGRNDAGIVADDKITVNIDTPAVVGPIKISPEDNLPILLGQKYHISVYSRYSDGVERDVTTLPGISYQSADESIVTVDSNGEITARKVGTTNIIARFYNNYDYEISVHVFAPD